MEPATIVALSSMAGILITVLGAMGLLGRTVRRRWAAALDHCIAELGLARVPATRPAGVDGAEGHFGRTRLRVEVGQDPGQSSLETWCVAMGDVPTDLELYPETFRASVGKLVRGRDIEVGDRAFDDRVVVRGADEAVVRALLDAPTRALIMEAPRLGLRVADGIVRLSRPGMARKPEELLALARLALALGQALGTPDLPGRLAQAALTDPDDDRALAACLARLARPPADAFLVEASTEAASGAVRLMTARRRGVDGVTAARALAVDGRQPMARRAEALALMHQLRARDVASIGRALLAEGPVEAGTGRVLMLLREAGALPDAPTLTALVDAAGPATRLALATCFNLTGGEAPLLALLDDADDDVAAEAARGLGQHGTVAAVPALLARARRGRIGAICQDAVDEIQKQIKGVRGSLAVVADQARGALSAADAEEGEG
ncbi:MAG: hypothetical protein H6706_10465 [Myxococcales bacterium]|nr:hypothetical protein [Myxococcales bacterium]